MTFQTEVPPRILITGATGNVGRATLSALHALAPVGKVVAGLREPERDKAKVVRYTSDYVQFDFADSRTFDGILQKGDVLFLLRPPQLADVDAYFAPLLANAVKNGIGHIVFLSVQGAPDSRFIPHHKIEKLIRESGVPYTFLRPAYFMQNFTTTLREELIRKDLVYLPAGKAQFTLIDVGDIGRVAAQVLTHPAQHRSQAYDLTCRQQLTFSEMTHQLSQGLGRKITYVSPSPWRFFWKKKKEGMPTGYILVLILLHYIPRFQQVPPLSDWVEKITGQAPVSFATFVRENRAALAHQAKDSGS